MTDTTQVDSTAAREAAMSRVQTQDTVLASLAAPASQEGAPGSKEQVAKDKPNEEDQKPSKKTAQERIVELAHKRKEAEAKAEASELRARELEARLQALTATAQPMEAAAKPARAQFAARQKAEQEEVARHWDERQQAAIEAIPDYAEVLGKSEVSIPPYVHQAILESEEGPQIAYYLALHPEEARRIAAMIPLAAIKRVLSLERDLAEPEAEPSDKKPSDPPKKSKAPEPITPVRSASTAAIAAPAADYQEYKRRRQAAKA